MKVEGKKWMVKKMEGDQKMEVAVTIEDTRMAKVICESHCNFTREYGANHTESYSTAIPNNFRRRSDSCRARSGGALETRLMTSCISRWPITRRLEQGRTRSITTAAVTPSAAIQDTRVISGRTGTALKPKRVCDSLWLKDQESFKRLMW
jgi:hypothetical protein